MTGVLVDTVSEVLDIAGEQIEAPPSSGVAVDTECFMGMAKIGESVKILLDVVQVLS